MTNYGLSLYLPNNQHSRQAIETLASCVLPLRWAVIQPGINIDVTRYDKAFATAEKLKRIPYTKRQKYAKFNKIPFFLLSNLATELKNDTSKALLRYSDLPVFAPLEYAQAHITIVPEPKKSRKFADKNLIKIYIPCTEKNVNQIITAIKKTNPSRIRQLAVVTFDRYIPFDQLNAKVLISKGYTPKKNKKKK